MQGIWLDTYDGLRRPKSKKEVKEAVKANPNSVIAEATSLFGNEYHGPLDSLPEGQKVHFVGPDPYRDRRFYGTVAVTKKGVVVT